MKSLQLCERTQIAEPRKYCLVRVIIFFGVCFFYLFCFSQVGILVKFPTTAIGSSPSGELEEGFPIRKKICLEISYNIVIVSNIYYWIPEDEEGYMILWQADVTKTFGWETNACIQNQETEIEP